MPGTKEGLIAMARERGGDDDALSLELFFAEAHEQSEGKKKALGLARVESQKRVRNKYSHNLNG